MITKPACLSDGMPSGGGTSIQSTWPERSAASRVLASGIGISTDLVDLGLVGRVPVVVVARERRPTGAARPW